MVAEHMVEEKPCETGSVHRLVAWSEMCVTSEAITYDPDRVVPMRRRQLDYEVHADRLPWAVRVLVRFTQG